MAGTKDETIADLQRRLSIALARNKELQKLALHYAEKAWELQR